MPRKIIMAQKPDAPISLSATAQETETRFPDRKNEKDGDEVVAHVKLHARVLEGLKAAFVGEFLA